MLWGRTVDSEVDLEVAVGADRVVVELDER